MTGLSGQLTSFARIVVICLSALVAVACGSESPEKLMASAKEYLAKGDRNAAVIQLKNLLTQAPNNGEARLLLGQALLDAEDFASAEKELARALELKQPHEKVVPAYALALLRQGKADAVVVEVQKYKLFDPGAVAIAQTALGDAYSQLGNAAQARDAYAAALAAKPGYPAARLGEARLLAREGNLDEALKKVDEAIAADPKVAESYAVRAQILLIQGDRDGSRKALEAGIAANGSYLPARLTLIGMLIDEQKLDEAARLVESTRRVAPADLRVVYLDALLAAHKGDFEKARQLAQQVLKYLPKDVQTLVLAGAIEQRLKQYAAAETFLRSALAAAPNNARATILLVQTYLLSGQPVKARDLLQPYVDRGLPNDQQLQLLAGETYLANADLKRAAEFFQAAAKWKEGSAKEAYARTRIGQLDLLAGNLDAGFRQLGEASELDPKGYYPDLSLVIWHLSRNEPDKALAAAESLRKKQPNNPLTYQTYGQIYLAKRNRAEARKAFEKALELQPGYLPAAIQLSLLDIADKKPDEARKRYEAMIRAEPNNPSLYVALADLQSLIGAAPAEVAANLQRAVKADPQYADAHIALMAYQLRLGDTKAALAAANDALAAMPSDTRVLDAAGTAQEAAGEISQAIGTLNRLASLQPKSPQPLYRLASLYVRQKEFDNAVDALRRIQKIAPGDRDVVPAFVQVYLAANRPDDALREVRAVQKQDPKFAGAWALEGDIRMAQRDFAEAERMYRQALKVEPKANAVAVKLHAALNNSGRTAEAGAWSTKWIAENPKDAVMHLYLGDRELAAKNLKAAAAQYQAVIALEPTNVPSLNNLAWIGGETGDPKALEYAERAVKLAPGNPSVLDTYGVLLTRKGDTDRAIAVLEQARRIAPARDDVRLSYAKALLKAGRKDEARKELEAVRTARGNSTSKEEAASLLKAM